MKENSQQAAGPLKFLFRLALCTVLGVVISRCFFDNTVAGAVLGLASYLFFTLFLMISDIVAINRELAAFRNGEESD